MIGYGQDEVIIRTLRPLTKKTRDAEGVQIKFSVLSVYSLIEMCLTYPDMHSAGWIEPDHPGFDQRLYTAFKAHCL